MRDSYTVIDPREPCPDFMFLGRYCALWGGQSEESSQSDIGWLIEAAAFGFDHFVDVPIDIDLLKLLHGTLLSTVHNQRQEDLIQLLLYLRQGVFYSRRSK